MKHVLETEAYHDGYRRSEPWARCVIAWKDVYAIERDREARPMKSLGYDGQAPGSRTWEMGTGLTTEVHIKGRDTPMIVRKSYTEVVQEFEHYLHMIEVFRIEAAE